jgi:hypothetical protein
MVYERLGMRGTTMRFFLALLVLAACFLAGCGGASSGKLAASPAAEGPEAPEPPPAPGSVPALEADEASSVGGEAREESVYRPQPAPAPARAAGVAQATPPPPPKLNTETKKTEAVDATGRATTQPSGVDTQGGQRPEVASPMLIYKAQLYMAVFETKKAIDAVEKLAKDEGGYLVSRDDTHITVRVPAGKFDGALGKIAKLGDLLHRNVSVEDVTDQYFDLQIRLKNLEAMRDRFEELLKKANKVEDALAVERELERVAGEIERLKGRLKLLHELVTFSTITVEFQPRPSDHIESQVHLPFPWLDHLGLAELLRL